MPFRPDRPIPEAVASREDFRLLDVTRNARKLRRGAHAANAFRLRVRDVGDLRGDVAERLARIRSGGVPNYFGPQRFGRDGANLALAARLFAGERLRASERGYALSGARSLLFNLIVGERVRRQCWDRFVSGDHANLDGRGSVFAVGAEPNALQARAEAGEIHPCATLWGRQGSLAGDEALAIEEAAIAGARDVAAGLTAARVDSQHRATRVLPAGLDYDYRGSVLEIAFELPPGAFATTVLWAVLDLCDATAQRPSSRA